jgi:hypothetical protein
LIPHWQTTWLTPNVLVASLQMNWRTRIKCPKNIKTCCGEILTVTVAYKVINPLLFICFIFLLMSLGSRH